MQQFLVHNSSRSRTNRILRAGEPEHRGHKQYLLNGAIRLVRGRPVAITEEQLLNNLSELQDKNTHGLIEVTTLGGEPFDLKTFSTGPSKLLSPKPKFVLDSVANDTPAGIAMGTHPREPPIPKNFEMPVPPPPAAIEQPLPPPTTEPPATPRVSKKHKV